jgi:hypothetical protein
MWLPPDPLYPFIPHRLRNMPPTVHSQHKYKHSLYTTEPYAENILCTQLHHRPYSLYTTKPHTTCTFCTQLYIPQYCLHTAKPHAASIGYSFTTDCTLSLSIDQKNILQVQYCNLCRQSSFMYTLHTLASFLHILYFLCISSSYTQLNYILHVVFVHSLIIYCTYKSYTVPPHTLCVYHHHIHELF